MRTKLAQMIEEAVEDCITFGRGRSYDESSKFEVVAEWTEGEDEIEITVKESYIIRFTYTEKVDC